MSATQDDLDAAGLTVAVAAISDEYGLDASTTIHSDAVFKSDIADKLEVAFAPLNQRIITEVFEKQWGVNSYYFDPAAQYRSARNDYQEGHKEVFDKIFTPEIKKSLHSLKGMELRSRFANVHRPFVIAIMPIDAFRNAKSDGGFKGALEIMRYADFKYSSGSAVRMSPKEKEILIGDLKDGAEMEKRKRERRKK